MKLNKLQIFMFAALSTGCAKKQNVNTSEVASSVESAVSDRQKQSDETMQIAMSYMDAMGKGDMDTVMALMHEDMVWQNEGDKAMPWIGPWNGKKDILEKFMPAFGGNFKTIQWDTEDAISSGDTAAFFGRMRGLLMNSNAKTEEFTFGLRVKVKDGKIILWNWLENSLEVSKAFHMNQ